MSRNQWIGVVVALVVVGAGAFFVGKSQAAPAATARTGFSANFGTGAAGGAVGGFTGRTGAAGGTARAGAGTVGKVVAVGSGNISIQMQNSSSSEIVLLSSDTQILKTVSGSASDIAVGDEVTVAGSSNSDGSVSATSISILPAGTAGRFGGGGASQSSAPMIPVQQ